MGILKALGLGVLFSLLAGSLKAHHQGVCAGNSPPLQKIRGDSVLVIEATADPQSGPALLKVTFTAQATGGSGNGYVYFWDFDNSDGFQVESFGDSVIYPFGHPGVYTVTLRAWDDAGNFGIVVEDVYPEFTQPEGDPSTSEEVLIADNLVVGCNQALQVANCLGVWVD